MKTLFMAISIDGYIVKNDYSTDWVFDSDFEMFEKRVSESDAIIAGKTTHDEIWVFENQKHCAII